MEEFDIGRHRGTGQVPEGHDMGGKPSGDQAVHPHGGGFDFRLSDYNDPRRPTRKS
jgi:hypothetical protein